MAINTHDASLGLADSKNWVPKTQRGEKVDIDQLFSVKRDYLLQELTSMIEQKRIETVSIRVANEVSRMSEKFSFGEYLSEDESFRNFVYKHHGDIEGYLQSLIEESQTLIKEGPEHIGIGENPKIEAKMQAKLAATLKLEEKKIRIYNNALQFIAKVVVEKGVS